MFIFTRSSLISILDTYSVSKKNLSAANLYLRCSVLFVITCGDEFFCVLHQTGRSQKSCDIFVYLIQ